MEMDVPDSFSTRRIGCSDVERLTTETDSLRAVDYRHGGGSCLDEILTLIHRTHRLLDVGATETVRESLCVAVADLHNLAGWTCFDAGLISRSQVHFSHALALAGHCRDDGLVANVFYRLGRLHLHHHGPDEALEYFQLGQDSATRSGSDLAASILSVNQAWAHAAMGGEDQAEMLLERGRDQFGAADRADPPGWARFFTEIDLAAMVGTVHTELAGRVDPRHAVVAIPALTEATNGFGNDMARSRTFSLIHLATSYLIDEELDRAVDVGFRALACAENLTSARVRDRMRPLRVRAEQHDHHTGARELATRIATFTAVANPTGVTEPS
jgi:hypothetical protein